MDLFINCLDICDTPKNITYEFDTNIITINKTYKLMITDTFISADPLDYASTHLVNLLKIHNYTQIDDINIFDMIMYLNSVIEHLYGYCRSCGNNIDNLNKITFCDMCINKSIEYVVDNCITDCYKTDPIVFDMLLLTGLACLKHPKCDLVFKPFPEIFVNVKTLNEKVKIDIKDIKQILETVKKCHHDYELYNTIGNDKYAFIKFLVKSNITQLKADTLFNDTKNIFISSNISNIYDSTDIITLMVQHTPDVEKRFNINNPVFAFHGSSLSSWYSILRNGLKNLSNTPLMIVGAAYGQGIYLASSANISYTYGTDRYAGTGIFVIGVAQVLNSDNYKQSAFGGTIYVVPKDCDVLLKYIIIVKNAKDFAKIDEFFIKHRSNEIQQAIHKVNYVRQKRLLHDYVNMKKICDAKDMIIDEDTNGNMWKIKLGENVIGVYFDDDYPVTPPFVWFDKISKKNRDTVSILKNGGVYIKELLPVQWSANTRIYKILNIMLNNMQNDSFNIENYEYETAKEEYYKKINELC